MRRRTALRSRWLPFRPNDLRPELDRHRSTADQLHEQTEGSGNHGLRLQGQDPRHYEEDHLIPLAVGGSPRSPKNLWPEPYKGKFGARVKDKLERFLQDRVGDGTVPLS